MKWSSLLIIKRHSPVHNSIVNLSPPQAHRLRETEMEKQLRELQVRLEQGEVERRREEWSHTDSLQEKDKQIHRSELLPLSHLDRYTATPDIILKSHSIISQPSCLYWRCFFKVKFYVCACVCLIFPMCSLV